MEISFVENMMVLWIYMAALLGMGLIGAGIEGLISHFQQRRIQQSRGIPGDYMTPYERMR